MEKTLAVGRGGAGGVARVGDFFLFFQNNPSLEKIVFFLRG